MIATSPDLVKRLRAVRRLASSCSPTYTASETSAGRRCHVAEKETGSETSGRQAASRTEASTGGSRPVEGRRPPTGRSFGGTGHHGAGTDRPYRRNRTFAG